MVKYHKMDYKTLSNRIWMKWSEFEVIRGNFLDILMIFFTLSKGKKGFSKKFHFPLRVCWFWMCVKPENFFREWKLKNCLFSSRLLMKLIAFFSLSCHEIWLMWLKFEWDESIWVILNHSSCKINWPFD